ncbi:AMP-dependent CoA ligase [Aspergillus mulundensis]|uniref:AMP-dependent CoA ligase n=1 Tax=Aspergillus mulundensis TaxID=1810919 RepID=A0A0G3EXT9_9EURO|nr:AMP-dependent CoA ligase [Aspergillus mulundensis]AKJ70945.1 AMP-dependent CoA ligase [Aspergillus mulundensis]RDW83777.1 AMP-dependent CoA ligase [Aspergillus mulundensis]
MVFTSPAWCSQLQRAIPETQLVGDFVLEGNGTDIETGDKPLLVCAATGKSYTISDLANRVDLLTRGLIRALGWSPNEGAPEEKVVGICSFNAMDFVPLSWAIHRMGGTCLLLHPTSSVAELQSLMRQANCKALFTCNDLLPTCQAALEALHLDPSHLFLLELPGDDQTQTQPACTTVSQLLAAGSTLPPVETVTLAAGESKHRVAYLCPTSGTSGFQKLAQITHSNIATNILQAVTLDGFATRTAPEVTLGILPLSHAYGLAVLSVLLYRRDTVILHARFDMPAALRSIQVYRIQRLYVVPAIVAALVNNPILFKLADLSSVRSLVVGSAPLSGEMVRALRAIRPEWDVMGGYGLTEAAVIVSLTSKHSIFPGSVGSLLPHVEARLVGEDGAEIVEYDVAGELLLRSPSIMKGYLAEGATDLGAFDAHGWLVTGDIACFRKGADGEEHLFIVDRKKDIMKVKGIQVAPAEIETRLLSHPAVDEAAVFGINDDEAGERPFAFVVRSKTVNVDLDEKALRQSIHGHIQETLSEPFWLRENIKFVEGIPKSHSGKALKFKLKELI